jgi:hypothetical protein
VVEQSKQGMVAQLEQRIQENKEAFAQLIGKLSNEILLKADTPEKEALADLKATKRRFDDLSRKAVDHKNFEETLVNPPYTIEEIAKFTNQYDIRSRLWTKRKTMEEDRKLWYDGVFSEIDAREVADKVRNYNQQCT